jgi:hypothetical protein
LLLVARFRSRRDNFAEPRGRSLLLGLLLHALRLGSLALEAALPGRAAQGQAERAAAQALVDKAHAVCPYSNATRGNIEVTITVV